MRPRKNIFALEERGWPSWRGHPARDLGWSSPRHEGHSVNRRAGILFTLSLEGPAFFRAAALAKIVGEMSASGIHGPPSSRWSF
jgi:hypothetical protein